MFFRRQAAEALLLLELKVTVSARSVAVTVKGGPRPDGGVPGAPLDASDHRLQQLLLWLQQRL